MQFSASPQAYADLTSAAVGSGSGLEAAFHATRRLTETLAAGLLPEDQAIQSMPDASPTKWHLAHTTWFFETFLLAPFLPGYRCFDDRFGYLFNSYYNAVGSRHPRPERGLLSRPSLQEVLAYRAHVDAAMGDLLTVDHAAGEEVATLIRLGVNHEQQHQELILTDILHLFSRNPLAPAYRAPPPALGLASEAPGLSWIDYPEGLYEIGYGGTGFAFDNERPRHRVFLRPFRLASRLVTNGEWQAFIADGGYRRPELWLSDGWAMIVESALQAPLYWQRGEGGRVSTMTLHGPVPIEDTTPVCHISYYEADAYARWAGARLPTEAEWEVAGSAIPPVGNTLGSGTLRAKPAPAGGTRPIRLPTQIYGDVWEWTASAYTPYPGYHPPAGAIGEYNGKFMCNQMVLRGGSCATPDGHVRASYRNFFYPFQRWQFAGVRLAADA
ncbi:MAG: ergothioneine biosynthesis protein EgtB [Rhodospirillales bacterium]